MNIHNDVIVYNTARLHSVHNLTLYYYTMHCSNLRQKCTISDVIVIQ